ncbi:Outer membrane receptor for ferrienterochelin and colicins [Tangfeifania diversioriginum]|uniref:Outer membrane receptor for ferrienterochelin and colicins n=1 Tax=Tangfeifania diversioriginum TaxID=1168035 RepID=A0A1M6JI74_9BACT|nr:TonB-dependent receptor [Tangfeifania diversioriginum]SHJ46322.1 Outer membrane receptor for ferrienterochelin and colicins [Tangfeifania diversioriginum]
MKRNILILLLIIPFSVFAQEKFTISGYVESQSDMERLAGATVVAGPGLGVATNSYGFYSLTLPAGAYRLNCRFVGYKTQTKQIDLKNDTILNFQLATGIELEEIEVKANRTDEAASQLSSLSFLNPGMEKIDRMPVILGERDVLKTLQFQPGIKSARENSAGFNVRGGSNDQNLILLDGVPVYNVNHLFGFFSVFNSDAIKDVSMYKGGIPARYGGRLSSVLDISMKEGNMKEPHGIFSISPVSARMTYEAPLKKDTAAFIVSLRRTLLDIPMFLYQTAIERDGNYGYYFYDFNAKTNWIINPRNRIYLSFYSGNDSQYYNNNRDGTNSKYRYSWGNITSVFRWNHIFSQKLFSNISAYYSRYQLNNHGSSDSGEQEMVFRATSDMQDLALKADFDWYVSPSYTIRFGGKASRMQFAPNIVQMKGIDTDIRLNEEQKNNSTHFEYFAEHNLNTGKFNVNLGMRGATYITGEKTYNYFEPRAALKFRSHTGFSANASYTQMTQFIHLLTNSSLGMPTDLWVASTDEVKPQESEQVSTGIEQRLSNYVFGFETYYKWLRDVIRFEEGAVFLSSQDTKWNENISVGRGRAYGAEFMAKKVHGKLTGMLSYTLSWSERQFNEVNQGRWFPHKYDRRHDISLLGEYRLFKNEYREKSISFGFTLQSGNNLSMPDVEYEGMYLPGGSENSRGVPDWQQAKQSFDNPNNLKMPVFHHLDLGYNTKRKKQNGKTYTWSFSVYNVYNRMNPWYYYKNPSGKVKQVSIFPVIPSVGFKYTF